MIGAIVQSASGRSARRRRPACKGFTLIEVLAVVTLLSMVAGFGVWSLAAANERAQIDGTAGRLQQLDRRARLAARTNGPTLFMYDTASHTIRIERIADQKRIAVHRLPDNTTISIKVVNPENGNRRMVKTIDFDRVGRSADYEGTIERNNASRHWRTNGLTGWISDHDQEGDVAR